MRLWRAILVVLMACRGVLSGWSGVFDRLLSGARRMRSRVRASQPATSPSSSSAAASSKQDSTGTTLKRAVPPILLSLLGFAESSGASPLNPQPVMRVGTPFFQGWLVRTVDHTQGLSFIFIVGSFSSQDSSEFTEHYVFCAVSHKGQLLCHQEHFPDPTLVTITGSAPSRPSVAPRLSPPVPLNVTWRAEGLGSFRFTQESCSIDFRLGPLHVALKTKSTLPWRPGSSVLHGPEGWLGYTPLLPCHYFVHSVGSHCEYRLDVQGRAGGALAGKAAVCHIEGNHGTFFPSGWIWSQAVSADNTVSLGLVAGLFDIGPLSPLNIVLYYRSPKTGVRVFRTTDLDSIDITEGLHRPMSSGQRGAVVNLRACSRRDSLVLRVNIAAPPVSFGPPVHIPTRAGFSADPGCRESYTAVATVRVYEFVGGKGGGEEGASYRLLESTSIPLACLEFGNSYV